jgi:hypothetical protein
MRGAIWEDDAVYVCMDIKVSLDVSMSLDVSLDVSMSLSMSLSMSMNRVVAVWCITRFSPDAASLAVIYTLADERAALTRLCSARWVIDQLRLPRLP